MNYTLIFTGNDSTMSELERGDDGSSKNHWLSLLLLPLIMVGVVGNILVCMAVTMEKRLQSVTNYFLLSLAITDLLVCIVVWPFSILHEFMGKAGFFEEKNLAYRLVKRGREGNGTVVAGMKKRMTTHNRQKSKAEIK